MTETVKMDHTWTHPICFDCYTKEEPGRSPISVKGPNLDICCFCGDSTTDGIYYRKDPDLVHNG